MSSPVIPFRIRQRKDDDLAEALERIPVFLDKSEIIREALRMYFFSAPTPLKDSYLGVESNEILSLPPPMKELSTTTHSHPQILNNPTMLVKEDLDKKLNKTLGF